MIWGIVVIVALVLFLALYVYSGNKPVKHLNLQIEDLPKFLTSLFSLGKPDAILFFDHHGSEKFLQFLVVEGSTIQYGLPRTSWSEPYFDTIEKELKGAGFNVKRSPTTSPQIIEFLEVPGLTSTDEAVRLSRIVLRALGIMNDSFVAYFKGPRK